MIKKKYVSIAAVVALAAGVALIGAAPASAASPEGCARGSFCGWWDWKYTGNGPYGDSGPVWFVGVLQNDKFSSVINNGYTMDIRAWDNWNYDGGSIVVWRGVSISDLNSRSFNDKISSFGWE